MSQQILTDADLALRIRFEQLREQWDQAAGVIANPDVRFAHPAYQAVIALGMPVVPLLLRDMEAHLTPWFAALRAITNENPARPEHRGDFVALTRDWLSWGRGRGLI